MRDGKKDEDEAYDPFAGLDKGSVLQVRPLFGLPPRRLWVCVRSPPLVADTHKRGAGAWRRVAGLVLIAEAPRPLSRACAGDAPFR